MDDFVRNIKKYYNKPKKLWEKYRFTVIMVFAIKVLIFFAWHFVSDGDFSFLMTLGSLLSVVSFGLLVLKYFFERNVSCVSMKALQCYALVFVGRLASILFYPGYLPFDKSGDWFYQTCEVITLIMVGLLLVAGNVLSPQRKADIEADSFRGFPGVPKQLGVLTLIVPCLILALILHPNLNENFLTDTAWTFALYLEAVAIWPQIRMFLNTSKNNEEVEVYTGNFVFGVAASRLLSFVFWMSSYHELNDKYADAVHRKYPGFMVVFAQLVNLVLLADYVYLYLRAAHQRTPLLVRSV